MKRALVLSGGGALGAYEVGALHYLASVKGVVYNEVYGVSVGAVNGAKLVMYPNSQLKEAVAALKEMWSNLTTKDVYKRSFPWGMLQALWNPSLYDSSPLLKLVNKEFDASKVSGNGYKFGVGATSWTTGSYALVEHTHPHINEYIVASAAFPCAFQPLEIEKEWWVDGGVRNAVPLKAALDAGADVVDMILTEAVTMEAATQKPQNVADLGLRVLAIMANEIFNNDFEAVLGKAHAQINMVRPTSSLGADPLQFEKPQNLRLIERGYEDASKQLQGA